MEFKSLLEERTKKEQYMIFLGGFLIVFYLFYLSWDYFERLYLKALMRYENGLSGYLKINSPTEIQNRIEVASQKLKDKKQELERLKFENEFIQAHAKSLSTQLSKFSSSSEILAFISSKALENSLKISKISPNQIGSNISYDYNISFSSTFDLTLRFIDELERALLEISEARFEPYNSEIRVVSWGIR
ncbi:hypothetical protein [Campylobacter porcelli]|uniref:Uncharacterized protein n=1 Tax=Campylobacter porcelli TaxID=1660073 RepID=A0ABU7M6C3_9BACT|nr:hypothetical protein [Campylobacter sp. CX2-4855-23]